MVLSRSALTTLVLVMTLAARRDATAQDAPRDSSPPARLRRARLDSIYRPEDLHEYALGIVGPRPVIRSLLLAGFDQLRKRPGAYPQTWRGFEDRLGTRYAQVAISQTLRFGLSRAFDERAFPYRPCTCGDTSSRLAYALLSPFRVNSPTGIHLSVLNPVSEVTSGILVTGIRPGGFHLGEGVRNGITGLAAQAAGSVVREYWPWKWRPPFL